MKKNSSEREQKRKVEQHKTKDGGEDTLKTFDKLSEVLARTKTDTVKPRQKPQNCIYIQQNILKLKL